jgi:hypothetical protein
MEKVYGVLPDDIRGLLPEERAARGEGSGA